MNVKNRDLIRVAIQLAILLSVALVAVKLIWPPDPHPLAISGQEGSYVR